LFFINSILQQKTRVGSRLLSFFWAFVRHPQDRALLYSRIIEGYSYEEISQQMGKSPSTLRKRYERAKKKLVDNLDFNYEAKGARI